MSVPYAITQVLEKAIESVLRMDPETRERLASINGQVVRVNTLHPSISLMIAIVDGNVQLSNPDDTMGTDPGANTTITGELSALQSLLSSNDAIYTGKVTIEGDLSTSQHLRQILAQLDPDWQEAVAPYLGDGLTHRLDTTHSRFTDWLRRTRESARLNVRDYLQEEIDVLAPNSEVRQYCSDVDEVRAAADRLAARIQRQEVINAKQSAQD